MLVFIANLFKSPSIHPQYLKWGLIIISLVERLRDVRPGRNTVVFLDELIQMGQKVLVFDSDINIDYEGLSRFESQEDYDFLSGSRKVRV
jgi:hypothetical protein